ncbi:MAG: hypothetical protein AB1671_19875 [Thermodesulfobacteriota bacterium]|jgi:hypothetical protein
MESGQGKAQTHEDRWWVDRTESREQATPEERRAPAGAQFFRSVENYSQEQALQNLTNLNLKLLAQGNPAPGEWAYVSLLKERCPTKEIERVKRVLPLPPNACAVLVDSGQSLRAIITDVPARERILEFNFITEASFDCWIRGEWVCEEVFDDKGQLLQHAAELLRRYLEKSVMTEESVVHAPRPTNPLHPARTEW